MGLDLVRDLSLCCRKFMADAPHFEAAMALSRTERVTDHEADD
jgi:hypothetical protein